MLFGVRWVEEISGELADCCSARRPSEEAGSIADDRGEVDGAITAVVEGLELTTASALELPGSAFGEGGTWLATFLGRYH